MTKTEKPKIITPRPEVTKQDLVKCKNFQLFLDTKCSQCQAQVCIYCGRCQNEKCRLFGCGEEKEK